MSRPTYAGLFLVQQSLTTLISISPLPRNANAALYMALSLPLYLAAYPLPFICSIALSRAFLNSACFLWDARTVPSSQSTSHPYLAAGLSSSK